MKDTNKRMETSKRILLASYVLVGILTVSVVLGTFCEYDTSNLTIVAGAAWAELAVHTAVYSRKAAQENRYKLIQSMVQTLSKLRRFEPDILVQLIDAIISLFRPLRIW